MIHQIPGEIEDLFLLNCAGGKKMNFQKEDTQHEPCSHRGGWFGCASPVQCDNSRCCLTAGLLGSRDKAKSICTMQMSSSSIMKIWKFRQLSGETEAGVQSKGKGKDAESFMVWHEKILLAVDGSRNKGPRLLFQL